MVTPRDGYPISRLPLKQKVTLLVDCVAFCNGPTTVTPSTDLIAQVAQVVILIRINIYILFSVGAAAGGVPAADWVSPQGGCHANYVGTCGGDTCRGDIAELGALIVEAVPEAGVPPLGLYPSLGYQMGPFGPKQDQMVPNGTFWAKTGPNGTTPNSNNIG